MDFIVQLPKTKDGYDAIVVFVDRLSKMVQFAPTTTTASAPDIAKIFFNVIFRAHGLPKVIVSDRDAKFTSHFWQALFNYLGTSLAMSTAFHPQSDGQTECANRTLEDMLRAYVSYQQNNWDKCLAAGEFAYNNSKQASTGMTPFMLNYGQDPITPTSLLSNTSNLHVPAAEEFILHMKNLLHIATDSLHMAQERQKSYADKKRLNVIFKLGEMVLLNSSNIYLQSQMARPSRKLQPKYIGPYKIIEIVSPVAYKLELPSTLKVHPVFHVSLLRNYKAPSNITGLPLPSIPEPLVINDHIEYQVEFVLDKRTR